MLLHDKTAVIYGGGGAIGGAVARAFAREGARIFLAGRTRDTLDRVARGIAAGGGTAETAEVDALDESAVDAHADAVAATAGGIDITLNAVGIPHVQGPPFAELSFEDFAHPIAAYTRTNFLTAKAVSRHQVRRGPVDPDAVDVRVAAGGPGISGLRRDLRRNRDFLAHPCWRARPQRDSCHLPTAACDSRDGRDLTRPRALQWLRGAHGRNR